MYLKSIEVNGFKSFANKMIFKFDHGITGIVGPNGSGKSNIGDAVRWVLGEQSAKQLRGSRMEDVIFSGTELRKPHGSAYVAITLDNSDHVLPVDYEEVTVARRVYRSGESEYLINGTVCRLRDVHAMFFDTGIGKEGYSIIGQGQIEKILSGKPDERRELFDEAAGIVKYKKNKAATEKELAAEHDNLTRINDILGELEHQVGPLKNQSEKAHKYLIYKDELKRFDVNAFLMENAHIEKQLEEYKNKLEIVNADVLRLRGEYDATKAEYERLENELEQYNLKITDISNQRNQMQLECERKTGEINVLKQQIENEKTSDMHLSQQMDRLNNELKKLADEKERLKELKNDLYKKDQVYQKEIEEQKNHIEDLTGKIEEKEAFAEKLKADIIDFMNDSASIKGKVGRYDTMLENIQFRKTELNSRMLASKSDDLEDQKQLTTSSDRLNDINLEASKINQEIEDLDAKLSKNNEATHVVRDDIMNNSRAYSSAQSKLEALRNISERYDGYGNSIKRVMDQKHAIKGIVGVVADIIDVDKKYEIAIETALGGSIQNIVTNDEQTAKQMIAYLKENKFGRATFLPLTTIKNRSVLKTDALSEEGVIGLASTLVHVSKDYQDVVNHLLGRILVVDHIDHAIKVARKYNQSLRIVTMEGELLTPGGAMTGGAFKNASNLLGRKRELEELTAKVKKLAFEEEKLQELDLKLSKERQELRGKKEEYVKQLQELYLEQNTCQMQVEQITEKRYETARLITSLQGELKELDAQIAEINKNKESLTSERDQQKNEISSREEQIAKIEVEIEVQKEEVSKENDILSQMLLDYNTKKQQVTFHDSNINRISADEKRFRDELASYEADAKDTITKISTFEQSIKEAKEYIKNSKQREVEYEEILNQFNSEKEKMTAKHKNFFAQREELSEEIAKLDKSSYRISTQMEKVSEKIENLSAYMWEEYELTYEGAANLRDASLDDLDAVKREIAAVKSKIKSLGDVNVNAIEEYKAVSERYEFLKGQHDDIVKAEDNLKGIIAELDAAMRKQFSEKFADIQQMFDKVFKELFGGGKSSLELVEDEDILEAGIRIIAQPPGKKLQNMMQLSGGEKSLTAIALLFAIQSLKPSPFCLLDEIEAALDDSNVTRFAKYLDKLTKDTQFIVITHRKGTMEAADILYGITMQEKGVSTLVSVNMIENELDD